MLLIHSLSKAATKGRKLQWEVQKSVTLLATGPKASWQEKKPTTSKIGKRFNSTTATVQDTKEPESSLSHTKTRSFTSEGIIILLSCLTKSKKGSDFIPKHRKFSLLEGQLVVQLHICGPITWLIRSRKASYTLPLTLASSTTPSTRKPNATHTGNRSQTS